MSIAFNEKASGMTGKAIGNALRNIGCATAVMVVLAGCARQDPSSLNIAPITYQQRHPIVVDTSPTTLDLPASNVRAKLTAGMKSAVEGFADDYRRSGAKGLEVLVPAGSSNEASASYIAHQAREALENRGVPHNHISLRSYSAESAELPGHVRLSFVAVRARVDSECGVWPTDVSSDFSNTNYHNFGCATQSNLAAIVADPNDLIAPRGNGVINAERSAIIVGDFEANTAPTVAPVSVSDAF